MEISRRDLLITGSILVARARARGENPQQRSDALQREQLRSLQDWLSWLTGNDVRGYLGEFGFPRGIDFPSWARLAQACMSEADGAGVWGTAWASGRGWGLDYNLGVHVNSLPEGPIDRAQPQAIIIEGMQKAASGRWGVNLSGFESGAFASGFQPYRFVHTDADFAFLATRGIELIRLPVSWERLQPSLGYDLSPVAVDELLSMVRGARQHGIDVILDVHNYARYTQGDENIRQQHVLQLAGGFLDARHLVDLWTRISHAVRGESNIIGFGLMNEPHDLPASPSHFDGRIAHQWASSTEGWVAESPDTNLSYSPEVGGVLVAERAQLEQNTFNLVRINDGGRPHSGVDTGQILRAMVRVDEVPPLPWRAELQYQDQDYNWHSPIQPTPLTPGQWAEVTSEFPSEAAVDTARSWGLQVTSDNVGNIATATVTIDELGSGRLAGGLSPAEVWEMITKQVVASLQRQGHDETLLLVAGYNFSKIQTWREHHPDPWINDPSDQIRYEAHHYWDIREDGSYQNSYEDGVHAAELAGF